MEKVRAPRWLFFVSLLVLVGIVWVGMLAHRQNLPPPIQLNTEGQPTVGSEKAKVHVVVYEEPKCIDCKRFNEEIFPEIRKNYIATNKIRYTVIPVSFLSGSMPAAVAVLCAYYQDPEDPDGELFVNYLDTIYQNQPPESEDWATVEKLEEFAEKTSPAIHLDQLKDCIQKGNYRKKIIENTKEGRKLMGGSIETPTLYIDGQKVETISVPEVKLRIDEALQSKGILP